MICMESVGKYFFESRKTGDFPIFAFMDMAFVGIRKYQLSLCGQQMYERQNLWIILFTFSSLLRSYSSVHMRLLCCLNPA